MNPFDLGRENVTVLAADVVRLGDTGYTYGGTILARIDGGLVEYVTWHAGFNVERGEWDTLSGHYVATEAEGWAEYEARRAAQGVTR